jgi:hypothetical protein
MDACLDFSDDSAQEMSGDVQAAAVGQCFEQVKHLPFGSLAPPQPSHHNPNSAMHRKVKLGSDESGSRIIREKRTIRVLVHEAKRFFLTSVKSKSQNQRAQLRGRLRDGLNAVQAHSSSP